MKTILKTATGAGLVAASVLVSALPAHADRGQVVRMKAQGFEACKRLERSGGPVWTATVRGKLLDGGIAGSGYRFNLKDCFQTQRECTQFVGGIENVITQVDSIQARICRQKY